jgi:hypothetical protein
MHSDCGSPIRPVCVGREVVSFKTILCMTRRSKARPRKHHSSIMNGPDVRNSQSKKNRDASIRDSRTQRRFSTQRASQKDYAAHFYGAHCDFSIDMTRRKNCAFPRVAAEHARRSAFGVPRSALGVPCSAFLTEIPSTQNSPRSPHSAFHESTASAPPPPCIDQTPAADTDWLPRSPSPSR